MSFWDIFESGANWLGDNPGVVGAGLGLASAFFPQNQAEYKWAMPPGYQYSTPPMSPQSKAIYDYSMKLAKQGFGGPETWNKVLNRGMEQVASRGLTPNATSGAFRKTLADTMGGMANQWWGNTMSALNMANQALSGYGPQAYGAQGYIQQPEQNWFTRFMQPYTAYVSSMNQAKAYNPNYQWSWW